MAKAATNHVLPGGFLLRSKDRTYEIVKVLGSGSFGITYLAVGEVAIGNIVTTMKFAIKEHFLSASCYRGDDGATVLTVPTAQSDVAESRSDFLTEANRLKKICLKSRNIVSVNEAFEANGTAYYVMEFLDGGNPGLTSEDEAVSIVSQIAEALRYIHDENVLHLDVKPDNIVLKTNEKGETYPVLIDFGISKHFDSKGKPTSSIGAKGASQGYAPQEQYAGITEFSPKYDIYALGGVLFYLLTGKNPPDAFKVSPNQQELKKELDGKVSPKVEKAVLNAMKPSSMERTPTIDRFLDDLSGIEFIPVVQTNLTQLNFDKKKGEGKIQVTGNIPWAAVSTASWCKVKGNGDNLIVSVSKNSEEGSSTRKCEIIVKGTSYPITRTISVIQQGSGTIVFPKDPTWWDLNAKKVYMGGAGLLLIGGIVLLCLLLKPDQQLEDVTEAEEIIAASDSMAIQPMEDSTIVEEVEVPIETVVENQVNTTNPVQSQTQPIHQQSQTVVAQQTPQHTVTTQYNNNTTLNNSQQNQNTQESNTNPTTQSSSSSTDAERRLQAAINDPKRGTIEISNLATIEHYAPSYYYYARQLLPENITEAVKYLKMSIDKGVNVKQSRELLEALEKYKNRKQ